MYILMVDTFILLQNEAHSALFSLRNKTLHCITHTVAVASEGGGCLS